MKKKKYYGNVNGNEDCNEFLSERINNANVRSGSYNKCTTKPSLAMEPKRKRDNCLTPKDRLSLIRLRQRNLPELIRRAALKLPLFD